MKILGLDLSYSTGWSLIDSNNISLLDYGVVAIPEPFHSNVLFDYQQMDRAAAVGQFVYTLVHGKQPDLIVIEQTNKGKNRTSQRGLEWIHYSVLLELRRFYQDKIIYVDTSEWRNKLNIKLDKSQRKHNQDVKYRKARGKITSKHLSVNLVNIEFDMKLKLKDNDIADAICLGLYAAKIWLPKQSRATLIDEALKDLI